MFKFNREEGLTLIELLITIAVLAVVAAIAVPVVTNVVSSTNERAGAQTTADIKKFIEKYETVGGITFDTVSQTFTGYVDLNGDGIGSANEKIEALTIDSKFTVEQYGDTDFDPNTPDAWGQAFADVNYFPFDDPEFGIFAGPDYVNMYTEFGKVSDYGVTDWRVTVN